GQPRARTQRRADAVAGLHHDLLRLGQQQPADGAERLMQPVELEVTPELIELARYEPTARGRHHRPKLFDQGGLADPRSTGHQYAPTPPGPSLRERRAEGRDLSLPAHDPRRRAQAKREVTFTDAERAGRVLAQPVQIMGQPLGGLVPVVRL